MDKGLSRLVFGQEILYTILTLDPETPNTTYAKTKLHCYFRRVKTLLGSSGCGLGVVQEPMVRSVISEAHISCVGFQK